MQIISIINISFEILTYIIFIRVILSWFSHNPYQPLIKLIYQISDTMLSPIRSIVSPIGGVDISPIIAIFIIQLIKNIILKSLFS